MKYISLFSGIGGFEIAINNIFPEAECIGYSEVDKFAIKVYKTHFPTHKNMGDITLITEKQIKQIIEESTGCNLIVGGFPCQNLSSQARCFKNTDSSGLVGPKSSLFYSMISIIKWVLKYNPKDTQLHILAENNASMKNDNKLLITKTIQSLFNDLVYITKLNGADFGVQTRRRLYWTTFPIIIDNIRCSQIWEDVLKPITYNFKLYNNTQILNTGNKLYETKNSLFYTQVFQDGLYWKTIKIYEKNYKSIWDKYNHSKTLNPKSNPIKTGTGLDNALLDYRNNNNEILFKIRYFEINELERLFFIPDGWVSDICSKTRCFRLLGNTVIVRVIEHILNCLKM